MEAERQRATRMARRIMCWDCIAQRNFISCELALWVIQGMAVFDARIPLPQADPLWPPVTPAGLSHNTAIERDEAFNFYPHLCICLRKRADARLAAVAGTYSGRDLARRGTGSAAGEGTGVRRDHREEVAGSRQA